MQWQKNEVLKAFEFFIELSQTGKIVKKSNATLFSLYQQIEIRDIIEELIEEKAKVKIFEADDVIYMVPHIDNRLYNYTNAELRDRIKLKSNKELYLTYLVMLILLAKFYNSDNQSLSTRSYVTIEEMERTVEEKMNDFDHLLKESENPEEKAEELGLDLEGTLEFWRSLPVFNEQAKKIEMTDKNRIGFLLKVFRFMEDEGLVLIRERELSLTKKMEEIVTHYYFNGQRKEKIMDLLIHDLRKEEA
jgi:hypothetical protein